MLTQAEYVAAVEAGNYPSDPRVPRNQCVMTRAGMIDNVIYGSFKSVAIIDSLAGAVRSNHYHKTDWHFMQVMEGELYYYWRQLNNSAVFEQVFKEGEIVFTPPDIIHATFFPIATRLLVVARNVRDHANHEADLVRVELIKAVDGKAVYEERVE